MRKIVVAVILMFGGLVGCGDVTLPLQSGDSINRVDFDSVQPASSFQCANDWTVDEAVSKLTVEPFPIKGQLTGDDGLPIVGARIGCWGGDGKGGWLLMSKSVTDAEGRYELSASPMRILEQDSAPLTSRIYVFAVAPNDRVAWCEPEFLVSNAGVDCDLKLQPSGGSVKGVAVDKKGQPLSGVDVSLSSISQPMKPDRLHPSISPLLLTGWTARTDQAGRFVFNHLPPRTHVYLHGQRAWTSTPITTYPDSDMIRTSPFFLDMESDPKRSRYTLPKAITGWSATSELSDLDQADDQAKGSGDSPEQHADRQNDWTITGRVVFNGHPIPHIRVRATAESVRSHEGEDYLAVTDSEGVYQIAVPSADKYALTIEPSRSLRGYRLIGNEPVYVSNVGDGADLQAPQLSLLRGERRVECFVTGVKGRPVSNADVELVPLPGETVLSLIRSNRQGDRTTIYGVPDQPIRVTATMKPMHRPGGGSTKMKATTPTIGPGDTQIEITLMPAKFFPPTE